MICVYASICSIVFPSSRMHVWHTRTFVHSYICQNVMEYISMSMYIGIFSVASVYLFSLAWKCDIQVRMDHFQIKTYLGNKVGVQVTPSDGTKNVDNIYIFKKKKKIQHAFSTIEWMVLCAAY